MLSSCVSIAQFAHLVSSRKFFFESCCAKGEKFFLRTPGAGAQAGEYRQTTPHLFTGGVHLEKRIHLEKAHAFRCTC